MSESDSFPTGVDCRSVVVGDVINRMLARTIPMKLRVTDVDDTLIHTGGGWTFDRATGAEVDEDLGWGPLTHTGSFIESWESGHG